MAELNVSFEFAVSECNTVEAENRTSAKAGAPRRPPIPALPWIGNLPSPRLIPMVAVNDGGYLVPLCMANDLLRGCKMFWRGTLD